ncbi:UDP-glucose 4-epimerase GalE, partial [Streptomyces sp. SID2119]|nr:UDP-glucose 4-epimerase GalE [Streptomyces sp. SID2119]
QELGWSARHDVRAMVASAWDGWCGLHPAARRTPAESPTA